MEADIAHSSSSTQFIGAVVAVVAAAVAPGGDGGATPLYKPYKYVPPHRVGFLRRFGLKTGIHFAHFGLESGTVFEGTRELGNFSSV